MLTHARNLSRRLLRERRGTITMQWAVGAAAVAGVAALGLSGVRTGVGYAASAVEAGITGRDYDADAIQRRQQQLDRQQQQQQDLAKKQQQLEEEMRQLAKELEEQQDRGSSEDLGAFFGEDSGAAQDGPVASRRFKASSKWLDDGDDD